MKLSDEGKNYEELSAEIEELRTWFKVQGALSSVIHILILLLIISST